MQNQQIPKTARAYELGYFAARAGAPPAPGAHREISAMIRQERDAEAISAIVRAFVQGHQVRTAEGARDALAMRPRPVAMPRKTNLWRGMIIDDLWPVFVGAALPLIAIFSAWLIGP